MPSNDDMLTALEKQMSGIEERLDDLLTKAGTSKDDVKKMNGHYEDDDEEVVAKKDDKGKAPPKMEDDDEDEDEDMKKADAKDDVKKADEKAADDVKKADDTKDDVKKVADDTITVEGTIISKSVVGDAQFEILKAITAKMDKAAKAHADEMKKAHEDIAKERDQRVMATLRKRADDEYAHVPGSTDQRAAMLKVLEGQPEEVRKSFEAVFTQAEKLAKSAFTSLGISAKTQATGQAFETKVADIRKRDDCTHVEALAKARKEYPDEYAAYQGQAN